MSFIPLFGKKNKSNLGLPPPGAPKHYHDQYTKGFRSKAPKDVSFDAESPSQIAGNCEIVHSSEAQEIEEASNADSTSDCRYEYEFRFPETETDGRTIVRVYSKSSGELLEEEFSDRSRLNSIERRERREREQRNWEQRRVQEQQEMTILGAPLQEVIQNARQIVYNRHPLWQPIMDRITTRFDTLDTWGINKDCILSMDPRTTQLWIEMEIANNVQNNAYLQAIWAHEVSHAVLRHHEVYEKNIGAKLDKYSEIAPRPILERFFPKLFNITSDLEINRDLITKIPGSYYVFPPDGCLHIVNLVREVVGPPRNCTEIHPGFNWVRRGAVKYFEILLPFFENDIRNQIMLNCPRPPVFISPDLRGIGYKAESDKPNYKTYLPPSEKLKRKLLAAKPGVANGDCGSMVTGIPQDWEKGLVNPLVTPAELKQLQYEAQKAIVKAGPKEIGYESALLSLKTVFNE